MLNPLRLAFAAIPLFAASALAQGALVAPSGYATVEGNTGNTFPWNRAAASMRIQFVYDSTNFTLQGVSSPVVISNLRYRPDAVAATTTWAGGSWPNVRIDLATSPLDYLAVNGTFANNLGADATTVHNGPVVVQPGAGIGTGIPQPWYIDIPLTTPFVYDPSSGNDLTVDIYLDGTGWTGASRSSDNVSTAVNNPLGSRIYATTGIAATTGTVATNYVAVCEFGYVPATGLLASFSATPTEGVSPLTVQFTDSSFSSAPGGITNWLWDFDNDGTIDSTVQSPSYTYTTCGDFTVSLSVLDGVNPIATLIRPDLVRTDRITANFTMAPLGAGSVQFTDATTPAATGWDWDFDGDGITDSTMQNPTWQFGNACSATIRLIATRACRTSQAIRTILLAPVTQSANLVAGTGTLATPTVGNLFDLVVSAAEGVTVCGLTSATYTGTGAYTASVYVTQDTYVGKDTNAALWRLVGTGPGFMNAGSTAAPSLNQIALLKPFHLPPGNYGMAIYHTSMAGSSYIAYTNGTLGPYAGADVTIHPSPTTAPGIARTGVFAGGLLTPRQWNGSLHYTKTSLTNQAGHGFYALGCAGTLGVPSNVATSLPKIGSVFGVAIDRLPLNAVFYWWGFSRTVSSFGPLPINLAPLGGPGCFVHASLDASTVLVGLGNAASFQFVLPNNAAIIGTQFFTQGLSLDGAANSLGLVATDAAGFIVGS